MISGGYEGMRDMRDDWLIAAAVLCTAVFLIYQLCKLFTFLAYRTYIFISLLVTTLYNQITLFKGSHQIEEKKPVKLMRPHFLSENIVPQSTDNSFSHYYKYLFNYDSLQYEYYTDFWSDSAKSPEDFKSCDDSKHDKIVSFSSSKINSLNLRLQKYYNNHVDISPWEEKSPMLVARDVVGHFRAVLKQYDKAIEFWNTGSVSEGLKVVSLDEFDVMVVLDAKENFLSRSYTYYLETPSDLSDAAGFYRVRRQLMIEPQSALTASRWRDPVSECIAEEYLSPDEARTSFKSQMDRAFQCFNKYKIRRKEQGPSVMLEVDYISEGQIKQLSIDFVFAYKFDDTVLVAKPHPSTRFSKEHALLWRVSYSNMEAGEVSKISAHGDCKIKCLKILKAVRVYRHAELGMLSSYMLKTAWLHVVNKERGFWTEECLSFHFILLVKYLVMYLEAGYLPHYFDPNINVLSDLSASARMHAVKFLERETLEETFKKLLKIPCTYR